MSPSGPCFLIRADDAASARSANEAIRQTVLDGIVRNISVMACGPELDHAARLLAGLPGVAFGLHATVNAEWTGQKWRPVLEPARIPSLTGPHGAFLPSPISLHKRGFSVDEIGMEVRAQLARARQAGFRITYLDTHMGFDWLEGVADLLRRICDEEGLIFDHASTHPRLPDIGGPLVQRLAAAPDSGGVLITHPGMLGGDMDTWAEAGNAPGEVARARHEERAALCSRDVHAVIRERNATLATYMNWPQMT
jgi:predicted glycoside hydrolase/deacetylase ChbG (UPF0249 family)